MTESRSSNMSAASSSVAYDSRCHEDALSSSSIGQQLTSFDHRKHANDAMSNKQTHAGAAALISGACAPEGTYCLAGDEQLVSSLQI